MFFEEYNLYEAEDHGYHECRIPALLTTANGTILAFNEGRKFTGSDSDQIDLFLRRSFDGGVSFGDVQVVTTKDGWVSGNPAPVQDRTTGTIWLLFCRNQTEKVSTLDVPRSVWVTSSNDDGETWNEPKEITTSVKPSHWAAWYATGPCHGIQMRSGRIVIPANHREKKQNAEDEDDYDHSHIIYSDDYGASWKLGGIADRHTNESTVLETADGWLYINSRNQYRSNQHMPYHRLAAWSRDGGESFSPSLSDAGLPEPRCQANVCRYTFAEDGPPGRGKNRVLFTNPANPKKHDRSYLTIRLSYDECRTWPVSKVICEGPSSYSDLCIAPDGTICCLHEKGNIDNKGISTYSGDISFARFDLEWLTDGADSLG